jgi:hypothetical protein
LAIAQLSNVELEMHETVLFYLQIVDIWLSITLWKKLIELFSVRTTNYDNLFDLATVDESAFIDLVLNPFIKAALLISHKLQRSE